MNEKELAHLNSKINEMTKLLDIMGQTNEIIKDDIDYDEINEEYGVNIPELEKQMLTHSPKLDLGYNILNYDSEAPSYNYGSDSGFDLYSTIEVTIPSFGRQLIPTGLSFDIPDGYEIQVRSKSGLAINQGLMCLNSPGTVDNGYTGEVKAIIFNTNNEPFTITKGMKVAQAVLCPVVNGKWVNLVERDTINEKERGENGFGSTGI
jgi:dUTP pyrophosphatase